MKEMLLKLSYILEVGYSNHDFDLIGSVADYLKGNGDESVIDEINKCYESLKAQEDDVETEG